MDFIKMLNTDVKEARVAVNGAIQNKRDEIKELSVCKLNYSQDAQSLIDFAENPGFKPISTGFDSIDQISKGGLVRGLYIIGGRAGMGKTSFVSQIVDHLVSCEGQRVFYITLEMDENLLKYAGASRFSHSSSWLFPIPAKGFELHPIPANDFEKLSELSPDDEESKLRKACIRQYCSLINGKLCYKDLKGQSKDERYKLDGIRHVDIIRAIFEKASEADRPQVVVIDYFQIMRGGEDAFNNERKDMEESLNNLRELAEDYSLPIIIISAVTDAGEFKGTRQIGYDANLSLFLELPEECPPEFSDKSGWKKLKPQERLNWYSEVYPEGTPIVLKVLKNRFGPYKTSCFIFRGQYHYFEPVPGKSESGMIEDLKELIQGGEVKEQAPTNCGSALRPVQVA